MTNKISSPIRRRHTRHVDRIRGGIIKRRGRSGNIRLAISQTTINLLLLLLMIGIALSATEYNKPENTKRDLKHTRQVIIVINGQQLAIAVRIVDIERDAGQAVQPLEQRVELVELGYGEAVEPEATEFSVVFALTLEHVVLMVVVVMVLVLMVDIIVVSACLSHQVCGHIQWRHF